MPLNRAQAVRYARQWAIGPNPAYPPFDNDCTSFVSQALLAGGWTMIGDHNALSRQRNDVWWYGGSMFTRASYTWAGAQNFHDFLQVSRRGSLATSEAQLQLGDVVQIRYGATVGHTMIITGQRGTDWLLSYHTRNTLDKPLSEIRTGLNPGNQLIFWRLV